MCKTHAQLLADGCHCDCIRLPAMGCSDCPTCDLHCMSNTAEQNTDSSGCATASECHENQTLMYVGRFGRAKCVDRKLHLNCTACDSYSKSTGGDIIFRPCSPAFWVCVWRCEELLRTCCRLTRSVGCKESIIFQLCLAQTLLLP